MGKIIKVKRYKTMKSARFIYCTIFLFIMNGSLHAQSKDSITAKKIIDKGSKGDIILGAKNKKDQLKNTPVLIHHSDSICSSDKLRPSKKFRRNQIKKGN